MDILHRQSHADEDVTEVQAQFEDLALPDAWCAEAAEGLGVRIGDMIQAVQVFRGRVCGEQLRQLATIVEQELLSLQQSLHESRDGAAPRAAVTNAEPGAPAQLLSPTSSLAEGRGSRPPPNTAARAA